MKRFCIGDIHGNYKGLVQALERSGFDYQYDELITLGDIVDGHIDSFKCVEELLKIKNRIDIVGNHDDTFYQWLLGNGNKFHWAQGGIKTAQSYADGHRIDLKYQKYFELDAFGNNQERFIVNLYPDVIDRRHFNFFHKQVKFYVNEDNVAFVHAGYLHPDGLGYDDTYTYMWSRSLWEKNAMIPSQDTPKLLRPYKTIFIGHTQTLNWKTDKPMFRHNVINLDTGAGYTGKVTIMDVSTKEYWQSDSSEDLGYVNYI
jgi:serine/threonine protein phosphatase 1